MPRPPRRHAVPLLALTLAACATASGPAGPGEATERVVAEGELTEPLRVRLGHTLRLGDGLRITFERVEEDSRCPRLVVCVWSGDAAVRLRLGHPSGQAVVTLHTALDPREVVHAGYAVRLHRLDPEPVRGGALTAFYEALLEVERR